MSSKGISVQGEVLQLIDIVVIDPRKPIDPSSIFEALIETSFKIIWRVESLRGIRSSDRPTPESW